MPDATMMTGHPVMAGAVTGAAAHIGYIYQIEGYLNGQRVVYVGSAASIKARLTKQHGWAKLLGQESTVVLVKKVYAELDVAASGQRTLESARREALRAVEERALQELGRRVESQNQDRAPGQKRTKILNKDRAATNPSLWQERHKVTVESGWRRIKGPGSGLRFGFGALGGGLLLLQGYTMFIEEKMSRYVMAPYVLEDEYGAFTLDYEKGALGGLFSTTYYKHYIAGAHAGERIDVSESDWRALEDEAKALWGTTDWKGRFVPGLLRPELPRCCPS